MAIYSGYRYLALHKKHLWMWLLHFFFFSRFTKKKWSDLSLALAISYISQSKSFLFLSSCYILFYTDTSRAAAIQTAATAATALRSQPTLSVILVAMSQFATTATESCAEVHIHLFSICILRSRSHLENTKSQWNYTIIN